MTDCSQCKDYRKCPYGTGKEWYHYGEIRFCPYQVIFIWENRATLLAGDWPLSPDGSIYIDPNIQTGFRDEAYFTKPEEILAEIEHRLKTTGSAGEALVDEISQGLTEMERLSRPASRALMYIKGWRRKRTPFSQWQKQVKYRYTLTTKEGQTSST